MVKVTDEENNETSISYDLAGRKTSMNDPDMGQWSYTYDVLGNLTRQTDARQERICFFYDDLNRITGKQYRQDDNCTLASGLDVTYLYDQGQNGKGLRTGMQDSSGESSWQYDEKGRLIEESKTITHNNQPFTFRTQWSYDASDRVHTMTYPADEQGNLGETVTYQYSQDQNKTRAQVEGLVSDLGTTYISGMEYSVYGQLTKAILGTSQPVTQEFNYYALDDLHGLGRLQEIVSYKSAQPALQRLNYSYDGVGNVQSELRYHPFGETRYSDGTTPTNRRFTGQIQDEGTGLRDFQNVPKHKFDFWTLARHMPDKSRKLGLYFLGVLT